MQHVEFLRKSILAPLLFLIYINDLQHVSNMLELIMFGDDTNSYYAEENIKQLFETVNNDLEISQWFISNNLFFNVKNYFFHKQSKKRQYFLGSSKIKHE